MRRSREDRLVYSFLAAATGWLLVALLLSGCGGATPAGPIVNNSGDGNCILIGPGTGGDQNGNQGSSGTGTDCRPVGKPVLSPVPVTAVESRAS